MTLKGGQLLIVTWIATTTCNFHCSYCPSRLNNGSTKQFTDEQYDGVVRFMKAVRDKFIDRDVVLVSMGGEPSLCSKLPNAIRRMDGIKHYLMTNGSRNLDWWKENGHLFETVNISYHHGHSDQQHFYEVCKYCSDNRIPLLVSIAMNPKYFNECYEYARYITDNVQQAHVQLKILRVGLHYTIYSYTQEQIQILKDHSLLKNPNYEEDGSVLEIIARYEDTNRMMIEGETASKGKYCNAGIDSFYINKVGELYRATCIVGGKIGNVTDETYALDYEPIICEQERCSCLTDVTNIRKSEE